MLGNFSIYGNGNDSYLLFTLEGIVLLNKNNCKIQLEHIKTELQIKNFFLYSI